MNCSKKTTSLLWGFHLLFSISSSIFLVHTLFAVASIHLCKFFFSSLNLALCSIGNSHFITKMPSNCVSSQFSIWKIVESFSQTCYVHGKESNWIVEGKKTKFFDWIAYDEDDITIGKASSIIMIIVITNLEIQFVVVKSLFPIFRMYYSAFILFI